MNMGRGEGRGEEGKEQKLHIQHQSSDKMAGM